MGKLRSLLPHVTFEEFEEKKQREHHERMVECTERDAKLDQHPYRDFIGHSQINGYNRRQCRDIIELNVQWCVFSGFLMGMVYAAIEHGPCVTRSKRFVGGFKYAAIFGGLALPYTWFMSTVCQWPNRGEMQVMSWENRFKDYIDKKYNWFDQANRLFYDTLTSTERIEELRAELLKINHAKVAKREAAVREFTTTGKLLNKNDSKEGNE